MYGTQPSTLFYVANFVQGTGTSNNGTFTSSNARDFGFVPAMPATVNATYNASTPSISGTISATAGTVSFSGGAIPGSLYNYNTPASLSTVSGAWTLTEPTGERLALNVNAGGAFSAASSSGCNFSGTVTPRPSGKNLTSPSLSGRHPAPSRDRRLRGSPWPTRWLPARPSWISQWSTARGRTERRPSGHDDRGSAARLPTFNSVPTNTACFGVPGT